MTRTTTGKLNEETLEKIQTETTKLRRRIGRNVLQARRKKRMALKELAEIAEITPEELTEIEIGQEVIKLRRLVCLAYLLDTEPIDLLK